MTVGRLLNVARGNGFVDYTRKVAEPGSPAFSYAPAFDLSFVAWTRTFGASRRVVIGHNVLVVVTIGLITWVLTHILAPNLRFSTRILIAAGVVLSPQLTAMWMISRYDSLAMLAASLLPLTLLLQESRLRLGAAFILGCVAGGSGIHLLVYAATAFAIVSLVWRKCFVVALIALSGVVFGELAMLAALVANGTWDAYLQVLQAHSPNSTIRFEKLVSSLARTEVVFGVGLALLTAYPVCRGTAATRRYWIAGLLFTIVVPLAFAVAGHYSNKYGWMTMIPAIFCTIAVYGQTLAREAQWRYCRAAVNVAFLAITVGFVGKLAVAVVEWRERDFSQPLNVIQSRLKPTDTPYCHFKYYYPVSTVCENAICGTGIYGLADTDKPLVNVMILWSSVRPPGEPTPAEATELLGGDWIETFEFKVARGRFRDFIPLRAKEPFLLACKILRRKDAPKTSDECERSFTQSGRSRPAKYIPKG